MRLILHLPGTKFKISTYCQVLVYVTLKDTTNAQIAMCFYCRTPITYSIAYISTIGTYIRNSTYISLIIGSGKYVLFLFAEEN